MAKETRKIGLSLICGWLFGVIFGLSGLSMLFTGVVVGGGALILASLIILPPVSKFTKKKMNFELSRGLKITAVIILFIIYAVSLSNSEISNINNYPTNQPSTQKVEASATQTDTTEPEIYGLKDRVIVGDFAYTFENYRTESYIGNEYFGEKADGVFMIFTVTIENVAKESKTLWGSYVIIVDDQERRFEHDYTAEIYEDDSFSFEQMQPGLPKLGKIVFDVPKDLKGFIEISSDNAWSDEVKYVAWNE